MRPVSILITLLILGIVANAQIPRATTGMFEYSGDLTADNMTHVMERARSFFSQPFLVHWDTVATEQQPQNIRLTGTGYVMVKAKMHELGIPTDVPVALQMTIEVKNGRYRYIINHFVVDEKERMVTFQLETKPASVKPIVYDQLISNTHKRMSFMIGVLRKYMKEE